MRVWGRPQERASLGEREELPDADAQGPVHCVTFVGL